jgi:hypothetical protein
VTWGLSTYVLETKGLVILFQPDKQETRFSRTATNQTLTHTHTAAAIHRHPQTPTPTPETSTKRHPCSRKLSRHNKHNKLRFSLSLPTLLQTHTPNGPSLGKLAGVRSTQRPCWTRLHNSEQCDTPSTAIARGFRLCDE